MMGYFWGYFFLLNAKLFDKFLILKIICKGVR